MLVEFRLSWKQETTRLMDPGLTPGATDMSPPFAGWVEEWPEGSSGDGASHSLRLGRRFGSSFLTAAARDAATPRGVERDWI